MPDGVPSVTIRFTISALLTDFFTRMPHFLQNLLLSLVLTTPVVTVANDVTVGFVDSVEPGYYTHTVKPTLTAIAQALPEGRVTSIRFQPIPRLTTLNAQDRIYSLHLRLYS